MKRRVGRYVVFDAFARGGMATVHLGRLIADRGFSRLVAIKMLTSSSAGGPRASISSVYGRALSEEARIASRIRHPNVVQPLDFVVDGDDLFVVMEYVHGVPFSQLLLATREARRARETTTAQDPMPRHVSVAILSDVLNGLHAAHEAIDERGRALGVVHRDVSPQNVLVGADGVARLADFGIAKVMRREEQTETGTVKGKLAYMPPEQLRGLPLTRQADIFSAGAVLAEAIAGSGPDPNDQDPTAWLANAINRIDERKDSHADSSKLLEIIRTATRPDARDRYGTAAEMSAALANAIVPARADVVAECVTALAGDDLDIRSELVRRVEAVPIDSEVPPPPPPPPRASSRPPPPPAHLPARSASSRPPPAPPTRSASSRPPATQQQQREGNDDRAPPSWIAPPPPITPIETLTPVDAIEPIEILSARNASARPGGNETEQHTHTHTQESETQAPRRTKTRPRRAVFFFLSGAAIAVIAAAAYARFTPKPPIVTPTTMSTMSTRVAPTSISAMTSAPIAVEEASSQPPPPTTNAKTTTPKATRILRTPRPSAPDCNPPFRIDAEGKKHYKPECVE